MAHAVEKLFRKTDASNSQLHVFISDENSMQKLISEISILQTEDYILLTKFEESRCDKNYLFRQLRGGDFWRQSTPIHLPMTEGNSLVRRENYVNYVN